MTISAKRPTAITAIETLVGEFGSYIVHLEQKVDRYDNYLTTAKHETIKETDSKNAAINLANTLGQEKKDLETQIGKLHEQVDAQFTRIEELQEELAQARADLAQAATGLGTAHGESDAQFTRIKELEEELAQARADLTPGTDVEELRARIVHLNEELAEAQKTIEEREDANAAERVAREHVKDLQGILATRDKELEKAKQELTRARNTLAGRVELAQQKEKQTAEQRQTLEADKEKLAKQLDATVTRLHDTEQRAGKLEEQLAAADGDVDVMRQQIIELMRESMKTASGGVRIALDKLLDPEGDYELDGRSAVIKKLRVAQAALDGDTTQEEEK